MDLSERIANLSPEKRALLLERLRGPRPTEATEQAAIQAVSREKMHEIPLSFAQQRLWILDQFDPGSATYNVPFAIRFKGHLDISVMERSLNGMMRRHESLRTSFTAVDGRPLQTVHPRIPVKLRVIDLKMWADDATKEAEILRLLAEYERFSFDLRQPPLLRTQLISLQPDEHLFQAVMHHIITDNWSTNVFLRELAFYYDRYSDKNPAALPELPIQYADYALWQQHMVGTSSWESQLAYWKKQLGGPLPVTELTTDYQRPPIQTYEGRGHQIQLSPVLTDNLKALGQEEGATLFMTLLAAFKLLLSRLTGEKEIIIGTPIAGRNKAEIEGLIGIFLNHLILRTDTTGSPTFRELLARVRKVCMEAYDHQEIPFEILLEELLTDRDLSRTPFFQIFVNMTRVKEPAIEMAGVTGEAVPSTAIGANFDLTLYLHDGPRSVNLMLVYNAHLFAGDHIADLLEQYKFLLEQIAASADKEVTAYSLVTQRAMKRLPDPTKPLGVNWEGPVHAAVTRHARLTPQALALEDGVETWTYDELDKCSSQLAHFLLAGGVEPEDVVVIYGHRSAALVWAIVAALKAGAAFLILDPGYPQERLVDFVQIAGASAWIQIEAAGAPPRELIRVLDKMACSCRISLPQRAAAGKQGLLDPYPSSEPQVQVGPDSMATVSFTSGSSGRPKAVMGRHGSLTHFNPWQQEAFRLSASDRFSMLSGLAHDPLQRDIFTPLWAGGSLHIPGNEIFEHPGQLLQWLHDRRISFVHLTPALFRYLAAGSDPEVRLDALRYAFFTGDKLTTGVMEKLRSIAPQATAVNSYGTTETQRAVGMKMIPPEEELPGEQAALAVGSGIPDAQLLILNSAGKLAGVGELGEIAVRSPHLALGYLGDKELTARRFRPNPTGSEDSGRVYHSGDYGRYRTDGTVQVSERKDRQVKIRGFRVELAEVERVVEQYPAVDNCIVATSMQSSGEERLIAYYVSEKVLSRRKLTAFIRTKLPDFMVPAVFIHLQKLPLTENGKIDDSALPKPTAERLDLLHHYTAPRNPLEKALRDIWAEVLEVEKVGIYDTFFELGGNSLLGIRVLVRIQEQLKRRIPLTTLFQEPTIARLSEAFDDSAGDGGGDLLVI